MFNGGRCRTKWTHKLVTVTKITKDTPAADKQSIEACMAEDYQRKDKWRHCGPDSNPRNRDGCVETPDTLDDSLNAKLEPIRTAPTGEPDLDTLDNAQLKALVLDLRGQLRGRAPG